MREWPASERCLARDNSNRRFAVGSHGVSSTAANATIHRVSSMVTQKLQPQRDNPIA